jgi:ATP-dependent DNA ligase
VVVADADSVAVFDALQRRGCVTDAILHAFDLLEPDVVDYRPLTLDKRKDGLANLLARARVGIALTSHRRTVPWRYCTPARWACKGSCRSE